MLIADLKNKLTLSELISEDFLTSSVFSTLKYINEIWVYKFLNAAVNRNNKYLELEVRKPLFEFWPWYAKIPPLKMGVEPDVVIYSGDFAIVIEAKNYSGKSGSGVINEVSEEFNQKELIDQLGREYFIGRNKLINSVYQIDGISYTIKDFALIFLTRHNQFPKFEINETLDSIDQISSGESNIAAEKIFWLNWQNIIPILSKIAKTVENDTCECKLAHDLLKYLDKRSLGVFSGFSFLGEFYYQSDLIENLFYNKLFPSYWGFMIKYKMNKKENLNIIFYKKKSLQYWEFFNIEFAVSNLDPIFYKGVVK